MPFSPAARWREMVRACREARAEEADATWQRLAQQYDDWVTDNDYVACAWPIVSDALPVSCRVLEIGPGSGAFTVPLARHARELTLVEPSERMRALLQTKLSGLAPSVQMVPCRIEEGLGQLDGPYDLALASFCLYDVEPIDQVVDRVVALAYRSVFIMGTGESPAWQQYLWERHARRLPERSPQVGPFVDVLAEMGITAEVTRLPSTANYLYRSEEAMVAEWAARLRVPEEGREALWQDLRARATRVDDGRLGIVGTREIAVVSVETSQGHGARSSGSGR